MSSSSSDPKHPRRPENGEAEIETAAGSSSGSTVGPYTILGEIGAGGMGVVYDAEDRRLGRHVAIKVLPLEFGRERQARERFFREARFISALDHKAICTIHDIGEADDGRLYFVMPYYSGVTLSERLETGPIAVDEARTIAIQLTEGLVHAHEHGITHRDIKPRNIMLTDGGQAKLLDFGVARDIDAATLTREGAAVGTPAYMSPEQSRGEPTDARSDLWSLGVVLYEMLAGMRPFVGDGPLTVMNAIANRDPEPLTELRDDVPPDLAATVARLMSKDPDDRHANAPELLTDLEQRDGRVTPRPPEQHRARWSIVAGVGVVAIVLALMAIPASRTAILDALSGAPDPGPDLVAVLPLVNNIGPGPDNQALTDGLTHTVTGMIARLGAADDTLWVVPLSEITGRGVHSAADARQLFGADTVLSGSVHTVAGTTEIQIEIIDPTVRPPRILDSVVVDAPVSPELRDAAHAEIAALLAVADDVHSRLEPDATDTLSEAAYASYLRGVGYLRRPDKAGNLEAAIASLEAAIAEDPRYGAARAALCQAQWERNQETDEPGLSAKARENCDLAAELASDHPGVLVALGRNYLDQGDIRRARDKLDKALVLEPENAEAYRWLAWAASDSGGFDEAVASLSQAVALEPRVWMYPWELGEILLIHGRYEEALEQFEQARALTPENYLVYNAMGVVHSELGNVEEADRQFRRAIDLRENVMSYRNLGYQRYRDGRYAAAVEELERARDLLGESPSPNDWIVWSWLAHAYYWAGDESSAADAWQHLIQVATPRYEVNPRNADVLTLLSDAHVALGERERGRFYLDRLLSLSLDTVYLRYYIGRIYEMTGDRELALFYVAQALEQGFDPVLVDRDPWLEDLRREPEYQKLRQQYLSTTR